LTKALEHGWAFTRIYFVRAQVRARLGDKVGAESDRAEGFAREPADEASWTARGFARLGSDPKGALADFEKALQLNRQYRPALVNKAHVLADLLKRPADAVAVLNEAIKHHPEQAALWAGRAVYLARMGRRADAHKDAEEALQLSGAPAVRYQVAGVYALTSKGHPEDRREAFRLLAGALKKDYGFEHLDSDAELAPVRDLPEFQELVAAARALRDRR
jgi:tetratricopeptide (TPR) repeat protein